MEIVNVCLWLWLIPALLPNAPNPIYIYIQQSPPPLPTHIKVIIKKPMTQRYANMDLEHFAIGDVFVFMLVRTKILENIYIYICKFKLA